MNKYSSFVNIPVLSVLLVCVLLLISACSSYGRTDVSGSDVNESTPKVEETEGIGADESLDDPSGEGPDATPKISANKVREAEEYAVTEPTEEQSRIISVYRQLYPEYKDSRPLCYPLYNDGEIFFVPEEWFYAYYPAVTGKTIIYQIDDFNVCAFVQTTGEKGEFRFGVFDENYALTSDVFSGTPLFKGTAWPHKIIERDEKQYLAVEYYYGHQGIRSSETVIYALPSMEKVWHDSEIFPNDPDAETDMYRFAINGDSFDVYDFVYHDGWMEEVYKTRIEISEIELP